MWIDERGGAWWSAAHSKPEGWDYKAQIAEADLSTQ